MSEWARLLASDKAWVVHRKTVTIGRIERFWSGEEGDRYEKGEAPAKGPVLETEQGDAFFAEKEDAFLRMSDAEVRCYQVVAEVLPATVGELALFAASHAIERKAFEVMVSAVLRRQLHALAAASGDA